MKSAAPISLSDEDHEPADAAPASDGAAATDHGITNDLVELLFFAYRDFVGDPDRMLAEYGFGRAHHRVLHFVYHYPGLTIAELLDILRITKQSLNRVLKDLIEQGHIVQKTGRSDRRQRLLYCSETGATLTAELTRVQVRRVARAIADPVGDGPKDAQDKSGFAAAQGFLMAMIEPEERAAVTSLMARRARSRP
ncbi:MarR family transcriptional regulator [Methylobacterium sp. Leaf93]|nr:MarR family transcriptional regulator [Methylobacterium sp. Leaf93]